MNLVTLPGSGRSTSQLAFGSSTLMTATGMRGSLALLETAYDAGVRHFDTAPSYGFGQSERCVGEFLIRHKGDVTVTTKYGIPPPIAQSFISMARGVVKPFLKSIPGIKPRLARMAVSITKNNAGDNYTVEGARATLENSLRQLRVEYIDLWLLHEAASSDLHDDALLRFMEDSVAAGKIGAYGVGSEAAKIPALYAERKAFCPVMQFEWSPFEQTIPYVDSFQVRHRVLAGCLSTLEAYLKKSPSLSRTWSDEVGADLASPHVLAELLLKAAILSNPNGITLFSSKNKNNIAANARIAADASLASPATRLHAVLRRNDQNIFNQTK